MSTAFRPCAIVPVYRHGKTLHAVCERLLSFGLPVLAVDDGNEEETAGDIRRVAEALPSVEVVRLETNRGKGGAVIAGFFRAEELGYTHAFQIDADGQHDLSPVPLFLEEGKARPETLVCGYPVYDETVPSARKNGRKITNTWVAIETLSRDIADAMCGFRLYPLDSSCRLLRRCRIGQRMTFDIEILVRLHWAGTPVRFLAISVIYPEGGISNFRMLHDNVAISAMHTRLFFGMLLRLPFLAFRALRRPGGRR